MRSFLFLPLSGVALQSRRGALCARQADGDEALYQPRVHGLRSIIIAGRGASIRSVAIYWCKREGVSLYVLDRAGACIAVLTDAPECDGRRRALHNRQKQFAAFLDPRRRLEIARKIVRAKLATLGLHPVDGRAFRAEVAGARSIEDLLVVKSELGWRVTLRPPP